MKTAAFTALGITSSAFVLACGPAAGTEPHAMSAAEHQAAAAQEQQTGDAHAGEYNPSAAGPSASCTPGRGACWSSLKNPSAEHLQQAKHHRKQAAQHRAASEALRNAEAQSCSGISEEDRDTSPFEHPEDIRSVTPLREEIRTGKATGFRKAGAQVVFAAVPGMTAEWLQRVVDCHLARNAAIGHEAASAEMPHCPLTLRGAQASVESIGDGFAVKVRADDQTTSDEILRRAEALRSAG